MKLNIIKIAFLAFTVSLTTISCKDFLDVNVNPNAPVGENLDLNAKLPAALLASAAYEATQLNQIGGFWGGYWGTSNEGVNSFRSLKEYNGPAIRDTRDGIAVWESTFNNLLYYKQILDQSQEEGAGFYEGIAKIMMAYHYFILVDFYNNVPFDEALQGSKILHPKYESGKDVYTKSMNLITEGVQSIKDASLLPTTDDIFFRGDKIKWSQFANTLKLRALLRQSEISGQSSYITSEIAKIVGEGSGFLTADAAMSPGFLNTGGKMNPFYETYYRANNGVVTANHTNIRPTQYLVDSYDNLSDPRLSQNYVVVAGDFKGVLFGNNVLTDEYKAESTSAFKGPNENGNQAAGFLKSFSQSIVVISLAESLFLQAEAIERGWLEGSSTTSYNNAIQASFNYLYNQAGANNYNIATYLAQSNVALGSATNKIERIVTQKWLALNNVNNIQAWHDFRRLGYPNFPNSLTGPTTTSRPLRFMYPETEVNSNAENVTSQGSDNILTSKVWWDVN